MASNDNINGGIQLVTDVIDFRMLKEKYLVSGLLPAHPIDYIISQGNYKLLCAVISTQVGSSQLQQVSFKIIKDHSNKEQTLVSYGNLHTDKIVYKV